MTVSFEEVCSFYSCPFTDYSPLQKKWNFDDMKFCTIIGKSFIFLELVSKVIYIDVEGDGFLFTSQLHIALYFTRRTTIQ